jgi:hypothetical protein
MTSSYIHKNLLISQEWAGHTVPGKSTPAVKQIVRLQPNDNAVKERLAVLYSGSGDLAVQTQECRRGTVGQHARRIVYFRLGI